MVENLLTWIINQNHSSWFPSLVIRINDWNVYVSQVTLITGLEVPKSIMWSSLTNENEADLSYQTNQCSGKNMFWNIWAWFIFVFPYVHLGDLHFSVYKSFPCLQKNKPLDYPHRGRRWSRTPKHFEVEFSLFFIPPMKI